MEDPKFNETVSAVAKELITELAPQEKALFHSISEAYFKDPEKALSEQKARDEMLGFGAAETITLLTPILLSVSGDVIRFLFAEAQKAMQSESSSLVSETVKSWFSRFRQNDDKKSPPPLTAEQLEQVRKIAVKKAQQLKLSDKNTKMLADAIVGSLATH
jgi:DNA replicative helicase MCM subunit Mcm2 (Cdc46/Mcm family)